MSRASYNNPQFQPFQSGSTLCYPSKDYANMNGGSSLISTKPGKNYFKTPDYKVSAQNLKTLIGKSYATSAGGSKKKKYSMKKGGNSDMDMMMSEEMMGGKPMKKKVTPKKPVSCKKPILKKPVLKKPVLKKPIPKKPVKKIVKKGGSESQGSTGMPSEFYSGKKYVGYPSNNGNGVMSAYGPIVAGDAGVGNLAAFNTSRGSSPLTMMKTGGRRKNVSKKGGAESQGATGMPSEFYSGKKYVGYPSNNGNGVMSAYGPIVAGDAGVGNLAAFNTSRGSSPLTMMKTGGRRKNVSKKGGRIPSMSDSPFKSMNSVVNGASKKIDTFSKDVKNNYNKSVAKIQQMRTGMARLQGGAKKKRSLKGGMGSDFISTLNSRGPANYPDSGEKMFRVFNKTGQYIPNSQLAYAAAPKLTGGPKVGNVTGFSSFEDSWAPVSGGAKRKSMKKKVGKKPVKGKKSTPKKKVGKKC